MAKTGLTYEMLCEEVLAQLIGKRGADLLAKETDRMVVGKIKEWISQYWKTFAGAIGLRDITELEASAMTIEQVADAIVPPPDDFCYTIPRSALRRRMT